MTRPVGVTILAVLAFLLSVFYVTAGVGFLSSPDGQPAGPSLQEFGPRTGWIFLLIGLTNLLAAYGLWKLRRWGWTLAVTFLGLNILLGVVALVIGLGFVGPVLSIAINALIIWYLLTPSVKGAFFPDATAPRKFDRVA